MTKLPKLNRRFHGWLDDHELVKFAFMMGLCVLFSGAMTAAPKHPLLAITGIIIVCANVFSRYVYISHGRRET